MYDFIVDSADEIFEYEKAFFRKLELLSKSVGYAW